MASCLLLAVALALGQAGGDAEPSAPSPAELDTVLLTDGGLVRGTVVENRPGEDLVLLLPDGAVWRIRREKVLAVDYARPPVQEAQPPEEAPPAEEAPPPSEERFGPSPDRPLVLAFSLGAAFPLGTLDGTATPMTSATSTMAALGIEAVVRLALPVELGAYVRAGFGSARGAMEDACASVGATCGSDEVGVGLVFRYHVQPGRLFSPWVAAGGGVAWLDVGDAEGVRVTHAGWEAGLSAGFDAWVVRGVGVGLFLGVRVGEYPWGSYETLMPVVDPWPGRAFHVWIDAGVRVPWVPP
jgi:hypothetical protein